MDLISCLQNAAQESFVDVDGEPLTLDLKRGLDAAAIDQLRGRLGVPLPADVRELLAFSRGLDFPPVDSVDFCGRENFEFKNVFPKGLPIAGDGFGNAWVVDIDAVSGAWGPVFFVVHDPAVIMMQSPNLAAFLDALFDLGRPGRKSALDRVRQRALSSVWRTNPHGASAVSRADIHDPELSAFAGSQPHGFEVFDLRRFEEGKGFCWGRRGPNSVVHRHPSLRLFAVGSPPPRKGLWQRLFLGL